MQKLRSGLFNQITTALQQRKVASPALALPGAGMAVA
jgi:hypothetical protein